MRWSSADIDALDAHFRKNLINSCTGFKPANLIGTQNAEGLTNLAIFSSVVHLGSDPALIGMFTRPVQVERHTYENILRTGKYTINQVSEVMVERAHHSSARFGKAQSEFDLCGFEAQFIENFGAPFVAESALKIGCELVSNIEISANGTRLLVGKVVMLEVADTFVASDGFIDLAAMNTMAISGLDGYNPVKSGVRFEYAKPDKPTTKL